MTADALTPMDRGVRLDRVRRAIEAAGCDALIVTKPVNIVWLTGFTGSNGMLVVTGDRLTLVTDGRYDIQVRRQLAEAEVEADVVITREPAEPVARATAASDRVGLESEHVTWALQRRVADWLQRQPLVTEALIETERRVKDQGELDRLRRAADIADQALEAVRPMLGRRHTEVEIARALELAMAERGADDLSFPTIVASGPNSALPHAVPTDRAIESGDLLIIDFGAKVDGYGSDMTRSFLIGDCSPEQRRIHDAVVEAQAAGVATVRAGAGELDVDTACRSVLESHGLGPAFVHGTGHGIGLEIHEAPLLSARATGTLQLDSVITVEPGAYLAEVGGVRIEDSVVVTEAGCEPITRSPKTPDITGGRAA